MKALVWLVLYRRLTFETGLSPEQVCDRLGQEIPRPKGLLGWFQLTGPYRGKVSPSSFRIRRNIAYANSFAPIVFGAIQPASNGSRIVVTMRPALTAIVLMLAICGFAMVTAVEANTYGETSFHPSTLIMVVVLYGVSTLAFGWEANKAMDYLRSTLGRPSKT